MGETAAGFDFLKLLGDPNFQSTLGGVGQALDPEGFGGRLGAVAQQGIQAKATQQAVGEQNKQRNELQTLLLAAIDKLSGVTPKGQEGVTGFKVDANGNATIDFTPTTITPQPPTSGPPTQAATPSTTATTPVGPQAQRSTTPTATNAASQSLLSLIPFF